MTNSVNDFAFDRNDDKLRLQTQISEYRSLTAIITDLEVLPSYIDKHVLHDCEVTPKIFLATRVCALRSFKDLWKLFLTAPARKYQESGYRTEIS